MRATGIGSLPGEDPHAAIRMVFGELGSGGEGPGVPYLPELPARGAPASMVGRALAITAVLDADLQPSGWRLTGFSGSPGLDHRRARSLLDRDLDALEEETQEYAGPVKVQVAGPWTLAATVQRPRGDALLADHGARRDLAQALAEGIAGHTADVRRRIPGADRVIVQVDEPALPAVLAGRVPTASGFGKHRSVEPAEASEALEWAFAAAAEAGAEPWLHSCAAGTPLGLARSAGARGLAVDAVDAGTLSAADHDQLAEALEAGETVVLGVVPSLDPAEPWPTDSLLVERVERWLDMLGLDPAEVGDRLVVAPACGLAGASTGWARRATVLSAQTARHVS